MPRLKPSVHSFDQAPTLRVDAGRARHLRVLEGLLEPGRVDEDLAGLVEVDALAVLQVGADVDVLDVVGVREQVRARGGLHLLAGLDVRLPGLDQLGLGDAGLVQDVLAVEQRARADVGRHGGEDAGAGRWPAGRVNFRQLGEQVLPVVRGLAQVLEAARLGEPADEADLDGHHVRQVGAGSQRGGHRVVVVGVGERDKLDLDVRVLLLPKRDRGLRRLVEARERRDGDGGLGPGREGHGRDEQRERPAEATLHVISSDCGQHRTTSAYCDESTPGIPSGGNPKRAGIGR